VEYTAYAPLLKKLAQQGVTCFLEEMPLNLAVMNFNRADAVIDAHPEIRSWYLAGHSHGGAFGAIYASAHADRLSGIILLAAYAAKPLSELPVLVVYASEDGVMRKDSIEKYHENLPADCEILVLPGGNHAMFGSYGIQPGDGEGQISPEEQRELTAAAITGFLSQAEQG